MGFQPLDSIPEKVQNYMVKNNVSLEQAVKDLNLTATEAAALRNIGGQPDEIGDNAEFSYKSKKTQEAKPKEKKGFLKQLGIGGAIVAAGSALGGIIGAAVGAFGGGVGAVPGAAAGAKIGAVISGLFVGASTLTSCSETTIDVNQKTEVKLDLKGAFDTLLNELKLSREQNKELIKLVEETNKKLTETNKNQKEQTKILEQLSKQMQNFIKGQLDQIINQDDIKNRLETILRILVGLDLNNSDNWSTLIDLIESIQELGSQINNKLDDLLNKFPEDLKDSLDQIKAYLKQNNEQTEVTQELLAKLYAKFESGMITKDDLQKIIDQIANNTEKIETSNDLLSKIFEKLQDGDITQDNLQNIIDTVLGKLDVTNELLTQIKNEIKNGRLDQTDLQGVIDAIVSNGDKIDKTNELLTKLMDSNLKKEDLQAVIDAIAQNGDKIDKTNELVNKYGTQTAVDLANILQTISNLKGDMETVGDSLVNKVINNMNANTDDILKAIANIKIGEGGTVDLSSVEKMLAELLKATGANNKVLTDINAKMDVLDVTTTSILTKLDTMGGKASQNFNILMQEIKNIANKNPEKYDDTKVLNMLAKILEKLDSIAGLIKDHEVHVTVDVTGKVKCECDCKDGNHEGILGDLEDILG